MWKPLKDHGVLRKRIVQEAKAGKAFWLLPEKDEDVWQYGDGFQPPLMRWVGSCQEYIPGDTEADNKLALQTLTQIDGLNDSIWSACEQHGESIHLLGREYWGFVESNARERHEVKKRGARCLALFMRSKEDLTRKRRPHPGYPDIMCGYSYDVKPLC